MLKFQDGCLLGKDMTLFTKSFIFRCQWMHRAWREVIWVHQLWRKDRLLSETSSANDPERGKDLRERQNLFCLEKMQGASSSSSKRLIVSLTRLVIKEPGAEDGSCPMEVYYWAPIISGYYAAYLILPLHWWPAFVALSRAPFSSSKLEKKELNFL